MDDKAENGEKASMANSGKNAPAKEADFTNSRESEAKTDSRSSKSYKINNITNAFLGDSSSITQEAIRYLSPPHIVSSRALLTTGNPFVSATVYQTGDPHIGKGCHFDPATGGSKDPLRTRAQDAFDDDILFVSPRRNERNNQQHHHYSSSSFYQSSLAVSAHVPSLSLLAIVQDEVLRSREQAAYYASLVDTTSSEDEAEGGETQNGNEEGGADSTSHIAAALTRFGTEREVFADMKRVSKRQQRRVMMSSSSINTFNNNNSSFSSRARIRGNEQQKANRRTAIATILSAAKRMDYETRLDEANSSLYRRSLAELNKKKEIIQATLKKREEEEAKQCTFKPIISDHAMQKKRNDSKPRGPLDFYDGGRKWVKEKEKRLDKKIKKRDTDQAEEDEVTFKHWQMNKRSEYLLKRKEHAIQKAEEEGLVRRGTLDALKKWRKLNPASKHHFPLPNEMLNVMIDPEELDELERAGSGEDDPDGEFDYFTAEERRAQRALEAANKPRKTPKDLPDLETLVAAQDTVFGNSYGYYNDTGVAIVEEIKAMRKELRRQRREAEGVKAGGDDDDDDQIGEDEENDRDLLDVDYHIQKLIEEDETIDEKTRKLLLQRHFSITKRRRLKAMEKFIRADNTKLPYWAEECHFHPKISAVSAVMAENRWIVLNEGKSEDDPSALTRQDVITRMALDAEARRIRQEERLRQKEQEEAEEEQKMRGKNGKRLQRTPEEAEAYARKLMSGRTTSDALREHEDQQAEEIKRRWTQERAKERRKKIINELLSTEAQLTFLLEAADDPDCDLMQLAKSLPGATNRKIANSVVRSGSGLSASRSPARSFTPRRGASTSDMTPSTQNNKNDDKTRNTSTQRGADHNLQAVNADDTQTLVDEEMAVVASLSPRGLRLRSTPSNTVLPIVETPIAPMPDEVAPPPSTDVGKKTANSAVASTNATIHRTTTPSVKPLLSSTYDYRRESPRYLRAVEERYGSTRFAPQTESISSYSGTAAERYHLAIASEFRRKKSENENNISKREPTNSPRIRSGSHQSTPQSDQTAIRTNAPQTSKNKSPPRRLTREDQAKQLERLKAYEIKRKHEADRRLREKSDEERQVCTFKPFVSVKSAQLIAEKEEQWRALEESSMRRPPEGVRGPIEHSSDQEHLTRTTSQAPPNVAPTASPTRIISRGPNAVASLADYQLVDPSRNNNSNNKSSPRRSIPPPTAAGVPPYASIVGSIIHGDPMGPARGFSPRRSAIVRGLGLGASEYAPPSTSVRAPHHPYHPYNSNTPTRQRSASSLGGERVPENAADARVGAYYYSHLSSNGPSARWSSPATRERHARENERRMAIQAGNDIAHSEARQTIIRGGVPVGLSSTNTNTNNNNNSPAPRVPRVPSLDAQDPLIPPYSSPAHIIPPQFDERRGVPIGSAASQSQTAINQDREKADRKIAMLNQGRQRGGSTNTATTTNSGDAIGEGNYTNAAFSKVMCGVDNRILLAQRTGKGSSGSYVGATGPQDEAAMLIAPPYENPSSDAHTSTREGIYKRKDAVVRPNIKDPVSAHSTISSFPTRAGRVVDDTSDDLLDAEIEKLVQELSEGLEPNKKKKNISDPPAVMLKTKADAVYLAPDNANSRFESSGEEKKNVQIQVLSPRKETHHQSYNNSRPPPILKSEMHEATRAVLESDLGAALCQHEVENDGDQANGGGSNSGGDTDATVLVSDLKEWFLHLVSLRLLAIPHIPVNNRGAELPLAEILRLLMKCEASPSSPESSLSPIRRSRHLSSSTHESDRYQQRQKRQFSPIRRLRERKTTTSSGGKLCVAPDLFDGTFGSFVDLFGEEDLSVYERGHATGINPSSAVVSLEVAHAAIVVAMLVEAREGEEKEEAISKEPQNVISDRELVAGFLHAHGADEANDGRRRQNHISLEERAMVSTVALSLPDARVFYPRGVLTFSQFVELFIKMYGLG